MPTKKHPPNNEPCPTCGGPCKIIDHPTCLYELKKDCYHTLHDTLVQLAVDDAVREIWIALQHGHRNDGWYLAIEHITANYPNAIIKENNND